MAGDEQMSESFRTATALALSGGFLETYTYLLHGHVFANAQTGNIALCGMAVAGGDWLEAAKYALPVAAFAFGVFAAERVRTRWPNTSKIHWRQTIVGVEAALLCGCLPLRGAPPDWLANLVVSLVCAFQVQAFRKVRGASYASTMCTGNLRSAVAAWAAWRRDGQREARTQALHYAGVIAAFLTGAACAVPVVSRWKEVAILLPVGLLLLAAALMAPSTPPAGSTVSD